MVEVVNPADGDERLPDEEHVPHHAVGNHAHRGDGSLLRRAVPKNLYFLTSHRGLFSSKYFQPRLDEIGVGNVADHDEKNDVRHDVA